MKPHSDRKRFSCSVYKKHVSVESRTGEAHEDPHRRETIQLLLLWAGIHTKLQFDLTPESSYSRETFQMLNS